LKIASGGYRRVGRVMLFAHPDVARGGVFGTLAEPRPEMLYSLSLVKSYSGLQLAVGAYCIRPYKIKFYNIELSMVGVCNTPPTVVLSLIRVTSFN
jgi:hypothetical protein